MQNNITESFQLIVPILAIIGGVLFIIFRKRIFIQQKKTLSLRDDYLGQKMKESYEGMTGKYWNIISIVAALGVIIVGIIKLLKII